MMSEWISVKDRLPESPAKVLVIDDGEHVVAFYDKPYGWWFQDMHEYFGGITHWQPLPELPNPSEEG